MLAALGRPRFLKLPTIPRTSVSLSTTQHIYPRKMGKSSKARKNGPPSEDHLLQSHPSFTSLDINAAAPIVDTHTHLLSTVATYASKYPGGKHAGDVWTFVRNVLGGRGVSSMVDVWCEAPVMREWRDLADSATDTTKWGGVEYWFVMGASTTAELLYFIVY